MSKSLFADAAPADYYNAKAPPAPVAWYGGKAYYAEWIIDAFPHHRVYLEPFGGAGNVLLRKHPSAVEVYNDLDGRIVNLFSVLRDREQFAELVRLATLTPYSREAFGELALAPEPADPVEKAWWFFVRCRQAIGGLGMGELYPKSWAISLRTRRQMAESVSKYLSAIDGLEQVAERLRTVAIEDRPAVEVVRKFDAPDALIYCDPPYVPETRYGGKAATYGKEMSFDDHIELLDALLACQAKVIISGYPCALYDEKLAGWRKLEMAATSHLVNSGEARTEVMWLNWA